MHVAFIGLGRMGESIASHIRQAGHPLTIHDRRPDAGTALLGSGTHWANSPADAVREAELVFTCLPGPAEVESAVLGPEGVASACAAGTIYVDLSTSSPRLIRSIAALLGERGCPVLDAPISGGVTGAEKGKLQIMVGGADDAYARVEPVLQCFGSRVSHLISA